MLRWIIDRCEDRISAQDTAIGYLPENGDIDTSELDVSAETMHALTTIDNAQWLAEMTSIGEYLESYGERLPDALLAEQRKVVEQLKL